MKLFYEYYLLLHKHQRRVEICVHLINVVMVSFLILTWEIWIETLALQKFLASLDICYPKMVIMKIRQTPIGKQIKCYNNLIITTEITLGMGGRLRLINVYYGAGNFINQ